jgi:hypothetical protein
MNGRMGLRRNGFVWSNLLFARCGAPFTVRFRRKIISSDIRIDAPLYCALYICARGRKLHGYATKMGWGVKGIVI